MSESGDGAVRSVGPMSRMRPNAEMSGIGWIIFLGIMVLLLPVLPFLAIIWLAGRLTGGNDNPQEYGGAR